VTANSSDAVVLIDRGRCCDRCHAGSRAHPLASIVQSWWPSDPRGLFTLTTQSESGPSSRMWRPGDPSPANRVASLDATGVWRQVETIAANRLDDPSVGQIVLTTHDVRERKTLERQLTQFTLHDLLTDLPNRTLFHDRVGQALASATGAQLDTTVLSVGLDGFKLVNQNLGHDVGDQVLQEVARRLRASVRVAEPVPASAGTSSGSCWTIIRRQRLRWLRPTVSSLPSESRWTSPATSSI